MQIQSNPNYAGHISFPPSRSPRPKTSIRGPSPNTSQWPKTCATLDTPTRNEINDLSPKHSTTLWTERVGKQLAKCQHSYNETPNPEACTVKSIIKDCCHIFYTPSQRCCTRPRTHVSGKIKNKQYLSPLFEQSYTWNLPAEKVGVRRNAPPLIMISKPNIFLDLSHCAEKRQSSGSRKNIIRRRNRMVYIQIR